MPAVAVAAAAREGELARPRFLDFQRDRVRQQELVALGIGLRRRRVRPLQVREFVAFGDAEVGLEPGDFVQQLAAFGRGRAHEDGEGDQRGDREHADGDDQRDPAAARQRERERDTTWPIQRGDADAAEVALEHARPA